MKTKVAIAVSVLGFVLLATPVLAESGRPSDTHPFKRGLSELKMRSCEARQDSIKNRRDSLINLVMKIEDVFTSKATRVEDFYTNKVLPTGKTVSNYDALVKDISDKKDIVTKDLDDAKAKISAFDCKGDDPKGLLTDFRMNMQKVKSDLKNYRTAIKNLIVAVKPLAPKETGSPKPTATP